MATRSWMGNVLARRPLTTADRRPESRRRLRMETLEDRTVPSDTHLTLELKPAAGQTSPAPVTIPLNEFSFGFKNPTTIGSATGGAGTGKAQFDALDVKAPLSPDSPVLLKALVSGSHYDTAVLTQEDAAGKPVAVWVLDTVFVTDDLIDNNSAKVPTENLTFAFGAVTEATADNTTAWSQVTNRADGPDLPAGLTLSPLPAAPAHPALTLELTPEFGSDSPVTIPLNEFSFGFKNVTTIGSATTGAGAGKAQFDALEVTAPFGPDSPELLRALVTGSHFNTAVLTQRDKAGKPVAVWALDTVFLTDDAVAGTVEGPTESLKFVFGAVTEATADSTTAWDQVTNRAEGPDLPAGLSLAPLPAPAAPAVTLDLTPALGSEPAVSLAVNEYTFGFKNPTTIGSATGGAGTGKAQFDEVKIKTPFGADSPELLRALVTGSHYETAVLTQRDSAGNPVAAWVLGTVFLSGDAIAGGDGLPTESLKFAFGELTEATADNTASWSQVTNRDEGPDLPAGLSLAPLPAGPAAPAITLDLTPALGSGPAVSVPVREFAFGFKNVTTIGSATTGAGAGKAQFDEFTITRTTDEASPLFFRALVSGSHFNTAVLTQRDKAGKPVAVWALGTVFVTGDQVSGSGDLPSENLTFVFGELTEATADNTTAWNQVTNRAEGPDLPAGLSLAPLPAPAAPAVTLDLTPIGTTQAPVTIPLSEFSFGFKNPTTIGSATGGAGTGKAQFDALEVTSPFGDDSPELLRALVTGSHYNTAVLTQRDAAGNPVAVWALGTVFLTNDAVAGGGNLPVEKLKFAFGSVTEATAASTSSWSQVTNREDGPDLPPGLDLGPLPAGPAAPAMTLELTPVGGSGPAVSVPVDGYAFGFHNVTTIGSATGGAGAGKAKFDDLKVTTPFGADSPELLRALVTGSHYETALLVQRNAAGRPVAAWALGTVFLSGDAIAGGDGLPTESLKFAFGEVTEATRAHTVSWSQVTNRAEGPDLPPDLVLVPLDDAPPTDIALPTATVAENLPAGTPVGTLTTTDPDAGDSFTYALVSGAGDTGNGSFVLDAAGHLTTAASFDFEAQSSYSIRVRSTDIAGFFVEKVLTVTVLNVNEAPAVTGFTKVGAEDNSLAFTAADFTGHFTDPDGDPLAAVRVLSLPTGGVLMLNGTAVSAGQLIAAADLGRLAFAPTRNFSGVVSFQYTASDGALFAAAPATITLDVRSAQQQAAALNQIVQGLVLDGTLNGGQGNALSISLKGNSGDAGKVRAFLNKLAAYLRAGILSPEQYAELFSGGRALLASVTAH